MVLKINSLHLPHKTAKRLKGHEPQQWIGRLWNWDKSHRTKNLIKLLKCVINSSELKAEPGAQELVKSCYTKLCENIKKRSEKKEIKRLAPKYFEFVKVNEEKEICPITLEEIKDPVVTPCGHKFERLAIERWLLDHWECPLDRSLLFAYQLKTI